MRQRTALIVAMVLTTFVLLIAAGLIGRLALTPLVGGVAQEAPPTAAPTELSEQQAIEYQQALQTANARLEQANRQLEDAYQRLTAQPGATAAALPQSTETAAPASSSAPLASPATSSAPLPSAPAAPATQPAAQITAEQAVAHAQAYVGGGTVERVRLEEEHGQLVYEVRFTNDSRVYIDPVSGVVVYARLEGNDDD